MDPDMTEIVGTGEDEPVTQKPKIYEKYRLRFLDHVDYEINKYLDAVEKNQLISRRILIMPELSEYWEKHVKQLVRKHFTGLKTLEIQETASTSTPKRVGIFLRRHVNIPKALDCKHYEGVKPPAFNTLKRPPLQSQLHKVAQHAMYGSCSIPTDNENQDEIIRDMKYEQPFSDEFWKSLSQEQIKQVVDKLGRCQIVKPKWRDFGFDVTMEVEREKYLHMVEAYNLKVPMLTKELEESFRLDIGNEKKFFVYIVDAAHAIVVFSDVTGQGMAQWLTAHHPEKFRPITVACKETKRLLEDSVSIAAPCPDRSPKSMDVANRMIRLSLGM